MKREPERRHQQASQLQADLKAIPDTRIVAAVGGVGERQANAIVTPRPSSENAPPLTPSDAKLTRQINSFGFGLLTAAAAVYVSLLFLGLGIGRLLLAGERFRNDFLIGVVGPLLLIHVIVGSLLIVAGLRVRALEGYRLGIVASLLAMLPIGPGWLVTFPLGLWSFLGLQKTEVRAAFGVPTIGHPLKWPGRLIGMLAMLAFVLWLGYGIGACVVVIQHYNGAPTRVPILDLCLIATAAAIEVPMALLMCLGAFRMTKYRSRRLALASAILALVPIGPTAYFGIPLGVWALVLLRRADVVAAFANRAAGDVPVSASADSAQFASAPTVPPTKS